jgi:DNA-binding transcriptional LysR family regulator
MGGLSITGSPQYVATATISQVNSVDTLHLYTRYVEIRQLEALVSISEHGSFSRAAKALGTVQSNISTRIARLESELGTELVDRSSGTLTESGAIVVGRAHRILGELRAIAADVHELRANISGQVTLGMIGTAGRWVVPLLLESLRSHYPNINLRISEGTNSALEPRLVNGQLDLAVLAWPVLSDELDEVDLFTEDLLLIARRDHPLAQLSSPLPFSTLAEYEILLPMVGTPIRREIDEAARRVGVELHPLIELDGVRTIASMTFDGHGPSILPATMLSPHLRNNFVGIPIENIAKRRVVLASRRFGFPAAPVRAIHALLEDVIANATSAPDGVYLPTREPAVTSA